MGRMGQIIFGSPERLANAPELALSASKGLAETKPFVCLTNLAILMPLRRSVLKYLERLKPLLPCCTVSIQITIVPVVSRFEFSRLFG